MTVDTDAKPTPPHPARGVEYVAPFLAGRQVTVVPSSIPDYADNCANAEEYVSACSCFGVTGTVTTAPTPTVTVTTTADACEDI